MEIVDVGLKQRVYAGKTTALFQETQHQLHPLPPCFPMIRP